MIALCWKALPELEVDGTLESDLGDVEVVEEDEGDARSAEQEEGEEGEECGA